MLTLPKDTPRLKWTQHIKNKMIFYNLSGQQVLRVFRLPERVEEGVAPETVAAMKTKKPARLGRGDGTTKTPKASEIWIMYKISKTKKVTMISAWRYPGKTKPGSPIPIPADIREELELG